MCHRCIDRIIKHPNPDVISWTLRRPALGGSYGHC